MVNRSFGMLRCATVRVVPPNEKEISHCKRLFELARVLARLDHVALTDLTHFRIFPRNLERDFTQYLCKQRKENGNL